MGQPLTKGTNLSRPRRVKIFAESPINYNYPRSDNSAIQDSAYMYNKQLADAEAEFDEISREMDEFYKKYPDYDFNAPLHRGNTDIMLKKERISNDWNKSWEDINKVRIARDNFMERNINQLEPTRDSTFIKEAEDLADFYKRTSPETQVDIIPFYGDEDRQRIKEEFTSLGEEDLPVLMGHSGSIMGGIPNKDIADMYKGCNARDLLIGSCNFNQFSEPFRETGKNVIMRPGTAWRGVNPYGETLMDAMYGTVDRDSIAPTPTYKKDYLRFKGNQILGE